MTPPRGLADVDARVVFVPVRHHSPACARVVVELIGRIRPQAVLIEGPSDYNDRIDELFLGHRLPVAIYTYVRLANNVRRGAFYPFCVYSPEWQALEAGRRAGAAVRFIDLPYADLAASDRLSHRYADAGLKRGEFVALLCRKLGVDDFDALWDEMFEADPGMSPETYLQRGHAFCTGLRGYESMASDSDIRREAFMAARIRAAMDEFPGRILVVTGGFHSPALHDRLFGTPPPDDDAAPQDNPPAEERGLALTPYSYERLDNLKGYESGMPNPGFYHQAWDDRHTEPGQTHRRLLSRVARVLRERGQPISSADLIAAETTARGLAALRGHDVVWRRDLVDGIAAALVKDEAAQGQSHPLLDAVHEVFRGGEIGRLAEGTLLPPLVHDLKRRLAENGWEMTLAHRDVELDLDNASDRERSRLLHQTAILSIAGIERQGGTDFLARDDLSRCWERWRLRWSPEHDGSAIEAARYGASLVEAASPRLIEASNAVERDAAAAAGLLLKAVLAGLDSVAGDLQDRLALLIRQDGEFVGVTSALGTLLHLYRFDATLGSRGRADVGALLSEAFDRGLWLLEMLGQTPGDDAKVLAGVKALLDTFERGEPEGRFDRAEFLDVLERVAASPRHSSSVRGRPRRAGRSGRSTRPRSARRSWASPTRRAWGTS
ncbi:MAG: DUF5682 family protein [Isosphaeraceae bacterium]